MEFKSRMLSNGLAVIGEINKFSQSAAVGFFVKTGARDETPDINGVSHFLEHMLFKGTEKLSPFEANEAFDRIGAKFNAFTSEENTVYYASVLPEYLNEVTLLWTQLMRPALREDDFNLEKNVIKEEIAMYEDHPTHYVFEKCRSLYFRDHPCGLSVLGSNESITNLTAVQMRNYFNSRYVPNNMVLACAGNFDWEQFCKQVEEQCNTWQPMTAGRKIKSFSGNIEKQQIEKNNIIREHICLMSPSVSMQDERKFAAGLFATIVGDDTGSRFFWELVDTAIAEIATMNSENMDGVGTLYSYISCDPQNVSRAMDIVRKIFKDFVKNGITDEELQKAKNKILSSLTLKNELPMGRLTELGFNWVYMQKYRPIEDDIRQVRSVSKADVNKIIEEFNPLNFTELAMGPAGTR